MIAGCSENAWNNHLDGFEDDGFSYTGNVNVEYVLTAADYETIGKNLSNIAVTQEEKNAASAIQSNHYFDQSSVYPAQVAIPYLLNVVGSDFYIYNNGSTAELTFAQAEGVPAEIAQISASKRMTLTTTPEISEIPGMLKTQYPDASEGDYAIVSYLNPEAANPMNSSFASQKSAKTPLKASVKNVATRSGETVWTVSEALAKMDTGYEGEANVIGVISEINSIDTGNYGNATYYIKDSLNDEESLEVYRGYYLNGDKFTSEDQLSVGATVVVTGALKNYNGTFEFNQGNSILYYYGDTIWTVSEALAKMADGFEGEALVRGVVSEINSIDTGNYGNATYFIKDNLNDTESLEIYRGYYLNGDKFTSEDQLAEDAIVIVSGKLTIYNGTYEFTTGSSIVNYFNHVSSGGNDSGEYDNLTDNIQNLEVGYELTATAVVTGLTSRGAVVTDNGGSILVYQQNNFDPTQYPIGTIVEVEGIVSAFNKGFQLNVADGATINITGSMDYTYPAPIEYNGAMMDEAIQVTENMLATYVSFTGELSISGTYYNVTIPGAATAQASLYYVTDEIKALLSSGKTYIFTGYYTSVSNSSGAPKFFNVVVTGAEEVIPEVADEDLVHSIYYYNGSSWSPAEGATVLNPEVYAEMGFDNNDLSNAGTYIPLYLKKAYPYALPDDEMFVAYNLTSSGASCGLFVFDGSSWTMNDNGLSEVVALFTKSNGTWSFSKYLGSAVFSLFEDDELILDTSYMWVSGVYCAVPLPASTSYARLSAATVSVENNSITMPNENYAFYFASSFDNDGTMVKVPDGYFLIKDSNNRYMYTYNTSDSINGGDPGANPTMTDGEISSSYLFYAEKQSDGTWKINNRRNDGTESTFYFSPNYGNWSIYLDTSSYISSSLLPNLYILQ